MTPEQEADLLQAVAELTDRCRKLEAEVASLKAMGGPEVQENCRVRLQENGEWARHYSNVRTAIATFLVPVSLGILAFKWSPPVHPPDSFVALAGLVWMATAVLFLVFTRFTFKEMDAARVKRKRLPDGAPAPFPGSNAVEKPYHPRTDPPSWVLALLTVAYGVLLFRLGNVAWAFASCHEITQSLHPAARAIPGAVVLTGLGAIGFTLLQAAMEKRE